MGARANAALKRLVKTVQNALRQASSDKQSKRLILAYKTASLAALALSLCWCAIFSWKQWWLLAGAEMTISIIVAAGWLMLRANRLNGALVMTQIAFLIFLAGFCSIFDVPSAQYPRVSHLFLLVLALLGYINYLRRRSRLQLAIIAAGLAAFVMFSSARLALPFGAAIPDDVRYLGVWINSLVATSMLCGCIYVLRLEFSRHGALIRELRAAVRNNELELFYQPQVDKAGHAIGAEALLRWRHPQRGFVGPGDFIAIAEESGLMPLIGGWVLKEACRTLADWSEDADLKGLTLAVNVSASQFSLDGFDRSVLDIVALFHIDPARLKLELTESVIISGVAQVVAKMNALRAANISFSLDDFGTGYSSLSYLRSLPFDQLKIDRSFVQEALDSAQGAALVKRIVQIGTDLGLVVLAEGVETVAQRAFLTDCGCQEFQGFYFGRPAARQSFETQIRDMAAISRNAAASPKQLGAAAKS